jgi:hypothetical protein
MSRNQLAQEWRERLAEFEHQNISIVNFCHRHRLPLHQFYYWKRRLATKPTASTAAIDLAPVTFLETDPIPVEPATGVSVRLAGATIDLTRDFDPATLRAVVVALSGLPC